MNEKFLELYEYLKSEGITDLSPEDFYNAYKDPNKAKDVYDFVSSEEMTDLNENDFFSAYFGTEVKKKDDSEVVTDTSEVVTDTSEVSESEVLSTEADETSETEEAVTPPINFDELTYFDFSSINRAVNGVEFSDDNIGHLSESKEEELLDLNINPHIQSLVSIGANMPEDANVAVTELSPSEKKTYDFNFSRYQKVLENQNKVKEVNVQKETNTGQYGFDLADASLPGLIPSLEGFGPFGGETTYNPVPGEDNYSNDPEVIAKSKVILNTDLPRARNKIIRIFKNKKKSYGLPSDITTATDEQLAEAFKKFNKENTYSKTGRSITTTMPISGGTSTEPTYEKDYININKKYLEKIFNNQFLVAKNNAQIELDKKVDEEKRTAIQNADSSILSRDVIGKRIYDFHKDYDYNNNMSTEEQRYSDAETVLEGLEVQLKKLTAEEKTPDDELITEWEKAKAELASAQKGLGDDIHPLYDPLTGERTDKLEGALDLTEQIKRHEKDALTFKGNIKNRYVTVSNREEDHRIMGGLMTRDLIVKDPRRWQKRANQEGFIIEPSDDGRSFIIKGVPLSKIGLYTSDILNKEVKNEAEEWNDKNAENIASRKVWMKMALTNIDPGKVDKSKTARFFEVLAGDGALAASFGMSDQKFVDFSVDEFTKAGIPLSPSLIKNMKRTWGMELTEQGAGFLPIAAQMWLGNKVLGAVGFAGWLKNTVQGLNTAKKFQRWNKFRGFILEASVEEVKMQTYGFHDGTGFGFTMAGRFMPAAGIFKFKGELARLNTVGNVVFDSGLKGAFALEFAGHVEAIVEDVKGGSAYGTFMEEQYPDVSTVGRRVILSGALFSIYGGMGLFGKGRSGMNIKNMESVVKELKQKGYNEEALKIQKNVDLYYEGKKKLSKEEQDILTENENGKGKEYNTDLTEAELKQRLKDMGGREVKPEAEVKAEEVKAEEVKVEEVKTTSIKKKKTEISNLEKQINKKKSDSKSEKLTKLREEAAKSLNFKPEVKEVKVEETTGKEVKVEETTGKEVKEPEKEVVVPEKEVVEILLNKKDGVFAGIWNRGGFSASNKAGDKDAHSANTRKVQEKSEELQKLESNNPKVNEGEFSVSGTFEGTGYTTIVGKEKNNKDARGEAINKEKMSFSEYTLENGDVVYSLINGKHRVRNREGYYAVNLTYKKGTEVKLNDVKNLLTTKMNDITTIITGVKSTVKPKVEPKVEPTVKEVTESIEEVKVEDSKSTNPSFEKGSMRNFSVDGGVLEIGRVNNASLSSILKLEVEKDSRRQGKAEVLLKRALNETKGELSGQASNDAAVALNYKLGMRVNGNETLSLKESQSERAQSAGESVSMVLPKNKRGDNYKPFKVEPTVKEKVIEPTVEPEYTKNNIINIKDPTDVLIQAKQKRKLANQKYNTIKDSLTEKQKNQFREESLKINNLIKNLEAEIVEKGVTGEKGEKEIQQYADKVIEGLESAKKTLKESGLTYSFILPGVNAKTLSVALDIGIASVKATKSAVIGLNKFKNSILTQLNIKKLTKAQEKQLNDFFNRNYDLSKQKVLSYTREIIKENKLDNVDSFIKEMESDPMFKKYDKQDLILLYNNSIKGSTLQLTNIKEKTENLKKGFFKGKTEEYKFTKQSKIEMDNVITEFNQFVETLDGSITASKETMRIIGNIKNKETLQTAINRIEELMSDKKVVEQVQEKENVINKITSLTNIKESEGKVKKSLSGGININPTTKLTKEQSTKLSTINTKLDNINKIIKDVSNKKTGIESEIKYSQEMAEVLESIERYETSTSEGFVSVSKGGIKNDKQLENAYLRLEELEFYNIYNLEVKSGNNSSLTNLMTKVEQFQTEGKSLSTILRTERAIEKAKIKKGAVVALKWDGSNFAKWWKKKFKTKETFTEDFNKGRTWYDVSGEKSHYNIIRTIDMFNNKDGKGVDYYKKNVYESYFDANRNKMKDEMALTNEMNAEISKIYGIAKGKGNIFTTKSTYITAEVGAKLTELGISKKQPFTQINFEGKTETVFKSDFGMLELWLIAKNPLEKAPLERMGWTPEKLKDLDNHLSPELKKLGEFMMEKLNGERYDKYSARYQENKGIGLPREASAPYYWPRRPDEAWSNIGKSEPSWDNSSWNNFSSTIQVGHHKSRTSTAPFKYDNAIATYMGYINKMEHYHHFQKPVEIYSTVFKDPAVRQSLNKNFGTSYTQAMDRHIDKMKGEFSAKGWEVFDAFSLQFSKNVLSASPAIAVKQAASSVIFASVTPTSYTIKSALSGGQYVKNIDAKTTSAYMMRKYRRYELGYNELSQQNIFFNESFLVKKSIKGQETFNRAFGSNVDLSKPARKFSSFNKKYVEPAAGFLSQRGDKVGMTWLGQGYLDYKYDYYASRKNETTGKLYTKKEATIEAVRDYEMLALSTQQTDMAMETSRWRQDMGSFGKLLTTFTTSMSAVREFTVLSQQEMINGKNVKQNAKKVAVSSVLLGTIFAFLNNGTLSDEKDVAYAIAKTNIQGFMFAGKVIDNMKGMDRYKPSSQVPFESHVYKIRGLYLNNKKSNDKWEKQIDDYALGKINLTEKELNVLRLENKQRKDKYLKSLGLELSVFGLPISLKNINKIATNAESAYYNEMKLQHLNKQLLLLTSKSKENISAEDIVETSLAKKVLLLNPSKYQEGKTVLELFTGQEKHPDEWFTLRNTLNDNWEQVMAIEKFKKNNAEPYDTDKFLEYYILNKNYKTSEEKIRKEQMELLKILELRDMKKEEGVNPVEEMRRQKILKPVK